MVVIGGVEVGFAVVVVGKVVVATGVVSSLVSAVVVNI